MISSAYEVSYVIQWVVICVLIVGLGALYSAFGALTRQLGQLRLVEPLALDVSSIGPTVGDEIPLGNFFDERGSALEGVAGWIFVTPGCAGCAMAKTALQNAAPGDFGKRVAVVVNGPRQQADSWVGDLPTWVSVVSDEEDRLFRSFNVKATPYYVLLDEQGHCTAKGPSEAVLLTPIHESRVRDPTAESTARGAIPIETPANSRA